MRDDNTQFIQAGDNLPSPSSLLPSKAVQFETSVLPILKSCPDKTLFLAAVSGGADSMAMLTALLAVRLQLSETDSDFIVLHVEHGLRPAEESCGDADFVRDFCCKNNIKCYIKHIQPGKIAAYAKRKGIGIEAAARFFRHKALSAKAIRLGEQTGKNVRILIAHTKDDALELSLMRVLRGCGPAGLSAMPGSKEQVAGSSEQLEGKREKGEGNSERRVVILRPLLSMSRVEVINYLNAKGVSWREDATNAEDIFLRNRIRNRLIPLLDEFFPSWKKGVSSMAETQSLAAEFISSEAKKRIIWENAPESSLRLCASARDNSICTSSEVFFSHPLIIREEALFQGINQLSSLRTFRGEPSLAIARSVNVTVPSVPSVPPCEKIPIKSIKRSVIRRFCSGAVKAADLGVVRVRREGELIVLSGKQEECFESGVSVLIKPE